MEYTLQIYQELEKIRAEMEIANQLKAMEVYQRIYGVYANTPDDIKEQIQINDIKERINKLMKTFEIL